MLRKILRTKTQPVFKAIVPTVSRRRFTQQQSNDKDNGSNSDDPENKKSFFTRTLQVASIVGVTFLTFYLTQMKQSKIKTQKIMAEEPKPPEVDQIIPETNTQEAEAQPIAENLNGSLLQSSQSDSRPKVEDTQIEQVTTSEPEAVVPFNPIDEYTRETQDYVDHYIGSLKNIKLTKITNEAPLEQKPSIVLAVPILFNENAIKAIGAMLSQLPVSDGQTPTVYYKIIQKTQDFEKLREQTGIDFRNKDSIYNTVAIHHDFLGQHMVYRLSDIINPQKRIFHDFKSIKPVYSSDELSQVLGDLEADELLVGLCHSDEFETRKKFGELLFKNYNLDVNKVIAVDFKADGVIPECQKNGLVAVLKPKHIQRTDPDNKPPIHTIAIGEINTKSVNDITNELGNSVNDLSVFTSNVVNVAPKHFRIEVTVDSNSQDKRELEKMEALFRGVKEKLGPLANEFEFVLNKRSIQNSEKDRRPIYGFDTTLIQKQMQYFYQNTDPEVAEKLKQEDRRVENLSQQQYQYPFTSLTTSNVVEFCHQLIEGRATPAKISQKASDFQRYSQRVVGKNFKEAILDNDKNHIVFYYSKNCGSCKRFLPLFEELAYDNLHRKDSDAIYDRINNDENQNPNQEVYVSTPKIVIYKNGFKHKPYEYRSAMLNKNMLTNFINITLGFEVVEGTAKLEQFANSSVEYIKSLAGIQLSEI
jgi:thiol-disulfide isomerase/thioredoxin